MTADSGIRALLVSCHSEAPRPVLTGGAASFDVPFDDESERNKLLRQAALRVMASNRALACSSGSTTVLPILLMGNSPQPLTTVTLCSTMQQTKAYHRGLYRLPVTYPAMYCGMSTVGEGTITNLSAIGCTIETDQPLLADQDVALCLLLPDRHESLPIELAHVRWANATRAGIEFVLSGTRCKSPAVRFRIGPDGSTRTHRFHRAARLPSRLLDSPSIPPVFSMRDRTVDSLLPTPSETFSAARKF